MQFTIMPIPKHLQADVACIRLTEYSGADSLSLNVCLNGLPGIVFQHRSGESPVDHIASSAGVVTGVPTLYAYGQMTRLGVMNHKKGPFTTIQVVLKPHALTTLLGINAQTMTNTLVGLTEFSAGYLHEQMLEAHSTPECVTLLTDFLSHRLMSAPTRDCLVEESLRLIQQNAGSITVRHLLDCLHISERQFERRFSQVVGLSPQFYIRVKRFNAAIGLMQTRRIDTLTDVAHRLNFYDQSHFIRDIKAFSGMTPKNLLQKTESFHPDHPVYAYV
ncbi:MAG: helix-turn-helix domain-containing protein [Anaerolineae bacterium]|nr:helix-turn-helix domain-containing protein [Anaerolineae bacterium]